MKAKDVNDIHLLRSSMNQIQSKDSPTNSQLITKKFNNFEE